MPPPLQFETSNPTLAISIKIHEALGSMTGKYISEESLSTVPNLRILTGALSTDREQPFFQPLSNDEVDTLVIKSGVYRDELYQREDEGRGLYDPAMFRVYEIENILAGRVSKNRWDPAENGPEPEGLIDKYWEEDDLEMHDDIFNDTKGSARGGLFNSYKPKNHAMAHVQAWLASGIPLREEKYSRAELATIVTMTIARLSSEQYKSHRVSPILFSSCTKHKLRVIVGYIDGQTNTIFMKSTPVLDFGPKLDFVKDRTNLCLVIGWHLSEPIGSTV
ncbi:hypothetical protein GGR53DRAFT_462940 [Hypoxylon sp. FL1150]|nr:hypothetical protein GGR53DRAFT_462940 [Hypoxylon sp. FL1150]